MLNMSKTSLSNCCRVTSISPPVIVDGQIISRTNSDKNLGFILYIKLSCIDQYLKCMSILILHLHKIKTIINVVGST